MSPGGETGTREEGRDSRRMLGAPGQGSGGLQRSQGGPGKGAGSGETIPGSHCSSQNEAARNSTQPEELQ